MLLYALVANIVDKPDGIAISGLFILGIIVVSLISRVSRTTELRADRIEFDTGRRQFVTDSLDLRQRASTSSPTGAQAGDASRVRRQGARTARLATRCPARPTCCSWRSTSSTRPTSAKSSSCTASRSTATESCGPRPRPRPNAIAAILLALRDATGVRPHCYFAWAEGSPLTHMFRYFLLGRGDTAPVIREIIRSHEPDPNDAPASTSAADHRQTSGPSALNGDLPGSAAPCSGPYSGRPPAAPDNRAPRRSGPDRPNRTGLQATTARAAAPSCSMDGVRITCPDCTVTRPSGSGS